MAVDESGFALTRYVLESSLERIRSQIITDILTYLPERILITPSPSDFILEGLRIPENQAEISEYDILCNSDISLSWLCQSAADVRASDNKTILMSNYPRETNPPRVHYFEAGSRKTVEAPAGTSLQLADEQDGRTRVAIYLVGMFADSYVTNLYTSQARGREHLTRLLMLVEGPNLSRLAGSEEADKVRDAADTKEQQEAIRSLSKRIDDDPEIVVYQTHVLGGGILVE